MKIAVSTYSFQRLINAGGMSQLDCIRQAREMGFDGVEIMELFPPEGMEREEYAGRIASLCRSLDLPVVNYTVSADFLDGSGKNPEAEAIRLQRQVDIAAILGAAGLRHDAAWGIPEGSGFWGFEEALPVLIEGCRRVTDYAASKGIRTMDGKSRHLLSGEPPDGAAGKRGGASQLRAAGGYGKFPVRGRTARGGGGTARPLRFVCSRQGFPPQKRTRGQPGPGIPAYPGGQLSRGTVIGGWCGSPVSVQPENAGYDGYVGVEFEGMEEPLEAIACGLRNLRRCLAWI